jgi:YVTN family beta-propeller protein
VRSRLAAALGAGLVLMTGACASGGGSTAARVPPAATTRKPARAVTSGDIYAAVRTSTIAPAAADALPRVYVPNSESNTVDVIDPATFAIVDHFAVGRLPQHVTPAWDLRTLYVDNDEGNSLTPIDPRTGKAGTPIPVDDPYNLYFTPDGRHAVVVAERLHRLVFRDPHTWAIEKQVPVPCSGVDHADFSADGHTMYASCEFSGWVVRIDLDRLVVDGKLHVGGQPIDVKLGPDGTVLYVANQSRNGVSIVDLASFAERRFVPTGSGAHGMYPSRDASSLYVTNRLAGTVSVLDFHAGNVKATWKVGGSPDMGGVSADGSQLWVSGRYNSVVYVIDTATGRLLHRIRVGKGPHGLCVWPQPGRYSLGHTGVLR